METKAQKIDKLGNGRILPLVFKYAWPAIVTMFLNQLYNIVDRVYIGHGFGKDAIAGLALTSPIMIFLAAIGVLIGMGCSALISIFLGAGDKENAEKALGQCVAMKLLFGLIVPPLMYFFGFGPILKLLSGGATEGTIEIAHMYLSLTIFFNLFAHLGFGLSATMRAEGSPRQSMYCMLAGCVTNIILDPLFIFKEIAVPYTGIVIKGLGFGVAGAAWATNLSMIVTCASALLFYLRKKSIVPLRVSRIRIYPALAKRSLAIGLSPCIMQVMGALISFSINFAFTKWSPTKEIGTIQISAYGIYMAVTMLFFIPIIGVQQGIAPIIGYNWGAESYGRVRKTLILGLKLSGIASVISCLLVVGPSKMLAGWFADSKDVIEAAALAMRIGSSMIWTIFVNVAATTYFQAVGRPKTAIALSLFRQCLFLLPLVWILPYLFENPILGIWLALPISDLVTQIATIPFLIKEYRFLIRKQIGDRSRIISAV